jgi:hypothetical protein
MHPIGTGRRLGGAGRDAGLDEAVGAGRNHVLNYRLVCSWNCQGVRGIDTAPRRMSTAAQQGR